jgi:ubiquitin-protein ligase
MSKKFISTQTQKRLLKDVSSIMKDPLNDQGIYYIHDEEDILKGYAMIFGPRDTPYQHGVYFFNISFPNNYPYAPPVLKYLTNHGNTRFNPNLYRNGKVCLSILNTWQGEQWTSCQSIRSVLLTLVTILNENPLLNEPGISIKNPQVQIYNKIIKYKNLEIAILNVLEKKILPEKHIPFYGIIKKYITDNKDSIIKTIYENKDKGRLICRVYNMTCILNYKDLLEKLTPFLIN